MPATKNFVITGLATVRIEYPIGEPTVVIVLDPNYEGDLLEIDGSTRPGNVYLRCNSQSAINNAKLAKFMETLHHWDHDFDGTFDGDIVHEAIEDALWRSREAPQPFVRPSRGLYARLLMALMPPQPVRHVVMNFGDLKPRFRWYHYAAALPLLVVIVALIYLQVAIAPWTSYSVVTGVVAAGNAVGLHPIAALAILAVGIIILSARAKRDSTKDAPYTYGLLNKAAVFEEQAFREGAENWGWGNRLASCLIFGAIHMVNLIYPIATILPLALGGALFMWAYLRKLKRTGFRRAAVLEAALWHRVYNRLALGLMAVWLVLALGTLAFGVIAIALGVLINRAIYKKARQRRTLMARTAESQ